MVQYSSSVSRSTSEFETPTTPTLS